MRLRGSSVIVGCLGALWSQIVFAQTPSLQLTLDEAIARAIEHAPRLAEARAREAAAGSTVLARRAAGRPTVAVTAAMVRTNHVDEFGLPQPDGRTRVVFPDIPTNYRTRAEMWIPLLTSGRVDAAIDAASADLHAIGADRRGTEMDLRFEVTRAYMGLATARESVEVLRQSLERTDAWLLDVKARVDAGLLPPNDVLSAQAQRARQSVRLISARNEAAAAEMELARLIGATPLQTISPVAPGAAVIRGAADLATQSPESLIARALERRPERESLVFRQSALELTSEAALAATRPQLGALAAVEPARPNPRFAPRTDEWRTSWDLGVQLTWSVFDGGRARAEHAAAQAHAQAVAERIRDFDALVAIDVRQRLLDLESGRAALEAAGEGVTAAAEARRVVDERFRAGVATSTDVLDAQVALLEAELERTRLAAALRVGEARLLRVVGGAQ